MDKIEQFIEKYCPHQEENLFPVEINDNKLFKQKLKNLMDSAVEEYLQEKLGDYDINSLEYKIIKSMLEEKTE